ncbi:MAG: sugar ABC transporter ATP-binding protein [Ilumatobacteraceae bacterium]
MLELRSISKSYPGVRALDRVDLDLHAGEVLALVGENGAGKSTLIKILSGAAQPDSGEILIDGEPVRLQTPADADRLGIATVYQEFNLFPALTVAENVMFGRLPRRHGLLDWSQTRDRAQAILDRLGTDIDASRRVADLSVAEQQMVEIAKALVREVRVLILDEPTAVLGGHDVEQLTAMVDRLRESGVGVIFVSHRLDEVFDLADRYAVLKDGQPAGRGDVTDIDHDGLVAKMVGREISHERQASSARGDELLRVEGLTRHGAFHDVSFTLHAGEVLGVAGLRGAGRTEVARAIFGADRIDAGTIHLSGEAVDVSSPSVAIRRGIGLVPEERKTQGLLVNLPTPPNVSLARHTKRRALIASPAGERATATEYVERLRIRVPRLDQPTVQLSGGNQQKVVLAKWLEAGVSVLILDEPTRGIDIGAKAEVYETIRALCAAGIGVLLISSELPELLTLSDRIAVMCQGGLVAVLDGDTATEELVMSHAVGGVQC